MLWEDLLAALALVLVLEGLMPALSPEGLRRAYQQIVELPDRSLRAIGLTSMIAGALLLYWVRSG